MADIAKDDKWYRSFGDWFGGIGDSFSKGFDNVKDVFSGGLSDIFGFVKKIFNKLEDVVDFLGDILKSIKDGFVNVATSIVDKIGDFMTDVGNGFLNLIDNIKDIPKKIGELLKNLFVPTYNPFEEIKNKIYDRFTIITQMVELTKDLLADFDSSANPPSFTINYGSQTITIFDFSIIQPYRAVIQSVIIAIFWVTFVIWLVHFAPRLLKGGG